MKTVPHLATEPPFPASNPLSKSPALRPGRNSPPTSKLIFGLFCLSCLAACGSDGDQVPGVLEFVADGATTIAGGDTVTLRYSVDGNPPPEVSLVDGAMGTATALQGRSGSIEVSPDTTTTFTLTARNKSGEASDILIITVVQPPEILAFALEDEPGDGLVPEGAEYRVVWRIEGDYDSVSVDGEAVPSGQDGVLFTASETVAHTLAVTWFDGQRTLEGGPLEVRVLRRPVIESFEASPSENVAFGTDIELTWTLGGGAPDSILVTGEGGGPVDPGATSHLREHVTNTVTHRLEVGNRAGTVAAGVTITVDPATAPVGFVKQHGDRVVVIRVPPTSPFTYDPDSGFQPVESAQTLNTGITGFREMTMEFYRYFEDTFDFLIYIGALATDEDSVYGDTYPWYDDQLILSDEEGLPRLTPVDKSARARWFGSADDRLRGLSFHPHMTDLREGPSLREIIRHWGVPFIATNVRRLPCDPGMPNVPAPVPGEQCYTFRPPPGEGFAGFSSNNGQLGGFDRDNLMRLVEDLNGLEDVRVYRAGQFSPFGPGDNSVPYSPWELYAAGMLPPDEIEDTLWALPFGTWHVDADGERLFDEQTGEPLFVNISPDHPAVEVDPWIYEDTIDDILEFYGVQRTLNADQSFVGAVVLVVDGTHLPTGAELDALAADVGWFSNPAHDDDPLFNFFEATGGRAQLQLDRLRQRMRPVPLDAAALVAEMPGAAGDSMPPAGQPHHSRMDGPPPGPPAGTTGNPATTEQAP